MSLTCWTVKSFCGLILIIIWSLESNASEQSVSDYEFRNDSKIQAPRITNDEHSGKSNEKRDIQMFNKKPLKSLNKKPHYKIKKDKDKKGPDVKYSNKYKAKLRQHFKKASHKDLELKKSGNKKGRISDEDEDWEHPTARITSSSNEDWDKVPIPSKLSRSTTTGFHKWTNYMLADKKQPIKKHSDDDTNEEGNTDNSRDWDEHFYPKDKITKTPGKNIYHRPELLDTESESGQNDNGQMEGFNINDNKKKHIAKGLPRSTRCSTADPLPELDDMFVPKEVVDSKAQKDSVSQDKDADSNDSPGPQADTHGYLPPDEVKSPRHYVDDE